MDKTEIYIKMADCPEIFNECKFQDGDWFHADGKSWMVYEFNEKVSLEEHRKPFEGIVFLPRQDDIQGMMGQTQPGILAVEGIGLQLSIENNSWEKFWLAFYMHEKHSKIWSSKEEKWALKN